MTDSRIWIALFVGSVIGMAFCCGMFWIEQKDRHHRVSERKSTGVLT